MTDAMLTAGDIARLTTIAENTLADWRKRGEGPRWVRLGRKRIAYPRPDFDAWLAQQEQATSHDGN